jgi:uncharacterized protein (TIGR00255 family)
MTGFGSGRARFGRKPTQGEVTVEVRSVNQRFLDLKLVVPRDYAAIEAELRSLAQEKISRGRVDLTVGRAGRGMGKLRIEIDEDLARAYVEAWRKVKRRLRLAGDVELAHLQARADVYRTAEVALLPGELGAVRRAAEAALRQHDEARIREGKNLEADMRGRLHALQRLARRMPERTERSRLETRKRIEERMNDLLGGKADAGRIVQEAALLAERSDVSEEVVRLESHLGGLGDLLASTEPVGRRIEFLLQEVQREVNTIASKSSDLRLTELALEAKGELEKLREQVQNVE